LKTDLHSALTAFVLLALFTLSGCLALPQTVRGADPGAQLDSAETGPGSGGRIDALELQSLVMGMADDYGSEIAEIVYLLLKPVATSQGELALAQSYVRNSFGAAAEIAAGPNPEVALLDLLVLVSLQRATFERYWIPEVWGEERGGPSLARLRKVEARLWGRSDVLLSVEQRATLRNLVEAWLRDNPDRLVVELIRFQDFGDERYISRLNDRAAASGLLREVGEAVSAIDDVRLYGERALWYSGRLIYILGEQMELTAYRIFANPRIETALADIDAFRESFRRAVDNFEALPELLRTQEAEFLMVFGAEREAAIKQLGDTLQANVMVALDELSQKIKTEREDTIDHLFTRFQGEREQLLTAAGGVDDIVDDIVDRIFWRAAMLVAIVFVGILILRYLPRR
jgi:hypothetical protein